jgi:hypothetical protein
MDWNGICHRLEKVVEILRTSYVCDGWQLDNAAAERSLAYVRALASGASEDEISLQALIDFVGRHGQSFDWVFRGDSGSMICWAAASKRIA